MSDSLPLSDRPKLVDFPTHWIAGNQWVSLQMHEQVRAENEHLKEMLDASRDAVEALLQQTAYVANEMAEAAPGQFDLIGAGTGVGIRLTALEDARKAIVTAGLKVHESRGAFDESHAATQVVGTGDVTTEPASRLSPVEQSMAAEPCPCTRFACPHCDAPKET